MRYILVFLGLVLIAASVQADDDVIDIGVILPLSGHTSNYGTEALKGINLAVEIINDGGGVRGTKLKLIVADNTDDPATTSQVVSRMIHDQNVIAVIGPITSTNSAAAAAVAQQAETPLILPVATSPHVTEIGEYICRICFTDPLQSKALAEFSHKFLKLHKVAVILEKGSAYSEKLAEFFVMRLRDTGCEVEFMESFEIDQGNLLTVVDQALAAAPDLIFAPVYYPEAAAIINRIAEAGSSVALLGGDGWESPELLRLSGRNIKSGQVFFSSHFSLQYPERTGSSFVEDFRKRFGDTPNAVSALGFDAVGVLSDALSRATVMNRKGVQQALISTSSFAGVTGAISINEKRNVVKDVYILKALEDEFVLETIISAF
ncbi:MAG: ABC transporter substrate-binding protein [candidate division Zixibacteria bacterium]|nr:ABC transporter substrate-binding protein [candidate division Zixibacteria bacterium]MDH3935749.1 ABC transporter substrate-binding protein [candidate division Zixibacteria bacterium]MDH4032546.1 ABC transporter substrate-binding protein [candidate division Zixibacteria bacterium]